MRPIPPTLLPENKKLLTVVSVFSLLTLLLHLVGGWVTPYYAWGFHFQRYVPAVTVLFIAAGWGIFASASISLKMSAWKPRATIWYGLLAVFVILLFVLRIHAHLLGDGYNVLRSLLGNLHGSTHISRAPGMFSFVKIVYSGLNAFHLGGVELQLAEEAFFVTGIVLFVALFISTAYLTRILFSDVRLQLLACFAILLSGYLPQFAGYVELYTLSIVTVLLFHVTVIASEKDGLSFWLLPLACAVALSAHVGNVIYLPIGLAAIIWSPAARAKKAIAATILVIIGIAGYAITLPSLSSLFSIFSMKPIEGGDTFDTVSERDRLQTSIYVLFAVPFCRPCQSRSAH